MPKEHAVKLVQPYFDFVWDHTMNCQIRKNDRDYRAGDLLFLHEYDPRRNVFKGRYILRKILEVIDHKHHVVGAGLTDGWVLLLLGEVDDELQEMS